MRHEVEIDTKLAELHGRLGKVNSELDATKLSLASSLGIRPEYVTRARREVRQSMDELLMLAREALDADKVALWDRDRVEETITRWHAKVAERQTIRDEMEPLNEEFAAKPWSRFFLVQNHGGHIHSSMNCSTCRITTHFGWLPTLSGLTERDAVEEHGPLLCSVCYPSAPVEWTVGAPKDESDKCPGSGEYVSNPNRRRYLACPTCGESVSITPGGKLRAHKRKEA